MEEALSHILEPLVEQMEEASPLELLGEMDDMLAEYTLEFLRELLE